MTDLARGNGGARPRNTGLARAVLTVAGGLLLVPFLTTTVAFQDMTSLLGGQTASSRWQAFLVPAPAGSIHQGKLAFTDPATANRLPAGAGLRGDGGAVYALGTGPRVLETPDEVRVRRADKSGRVLSATPIAPPKAFTAGSILERQSMLRPGRAAGDSAVRTAFAVPAKVQNNVALAMAFKSTRPELQAPAVEDAVMVASLQTPSGPATTALGYAPSSPAPRSASPFAAILREQPSFVPPLGKGDHAWAATPLPASAFSKQEQSCLADGIYHEARGEPVMGQAAVAQVILNRVRNPTYPKTICGVVYQNKNWLNRCQFSFACDGIRKHVTDRQSWATAKRVAGQVSRGEIWLNEVGSATHYHATYVNPRWAKAMKRVDTIGSHIFYRTFKGGWN